MRLLQAEPHERARAAWVLREANAAVGQKLCRFDLTNGFVNQSAELPTLLISDCCAKILHFDQSFTYEHDLSYFRDSGDPRVAEQLWVKAEKALRFLGIAA